MKHVSQAGPRLGFCYQGASHPSRLLRILLLHKCAHTLGISKCPGGQLVKYTDLGEDVEIGKLLWLLLIAEGVALGRFGEVLTTCVLVKDLWPAWCYYGFMQIA